MHRVISVGRVGADPVMEEYGDNRKCRFSIASSEKIKGESVTTWFDWEAWNNRAETLCKYVKRGDMLVVIGDLAVSQYEDDTGAKRRRVYGKVRDFQFCTSRQEERKEEQVEEIPEEPVYREQKQESFQDILENEVWY